MILIHDLTKLFHFINLHVHAHVQWREEGCQRRLTGLNQPNHGRDEDHTDQSPNKKTVLILVSVNESHGNCPGKNGNNDELTCNDIKNTQAFIDSIS